MLWKYLEVFAPNDLFLFVLFLLFFTTFSYHEIVKKKIVATMVLHYITIYCDVVPVSRYISYRQFLRDTLTLGADKFFFFLCVFSLTLLVSCSSLSGSSLSDAAVVFSPGVKHSRRRISFYSSSCNVN